LIFSSLHSIPIATDSALCRLPQRVSCKQPVLEMRLPLSVTVHAPSLLVVSHHQVNQRRTA
jgi:hypothetical protein